MSHTIERCRGKWIRIGTFADPDLQMCPLCRGQRRASGIEDEDTDVVEIFDDGTAGDDSERSSDLPGPAMATGMAVAKAIAIGLTISAVMTALIAALLLR